MAKGINVDVSMNMDKFQQKLRAIAKHTGALADELDTIDKIVICPKCGSDDVCAYRTGQELILEDATCNNCNYELPTRLEGSD